MILGILALVFYFFGTLRSEVFLRRMHVSRAKEADLD